MELTPLVLVVSLAACFFAFIAGFRDGRSL